MGVSLLGYIPLASLLLAAIMASNTLIAYPIVGRYGLTRHTSSTLSVGSSMMALFMALIVMASIVNSFHGNGGILFWLLFILKFVAYCVGLIMVIPRVTRWFLPSIFRRCDAVYLHPCSGVSLGSIVRCCGFRRNLWSVHVRFDIWNRFVPKVSPI